MATLPEELISVLMLNSNDFISVKDELQPDEETSLLLRDKEACENIQEDEHGNLRKCENSSV